MVVEDEEFVFRRPVWSAGTIGLGVVMMVLGVVVIDELTCWIV